MERKIVGYQVIKHGGSLGEYYGVGYSVKPVYEN